MKPMGTALITEKNKRFTEHPWIFLFEVAIDSADGPWRFAAYPEPIDWNGYTWAAMSASVEMIRQDSSGRLAGVDLHVSNVALEVSTYQETYDLRGRDVAIYIINRGHLDETTVVSFTYRVNNIQRGDTDAIFELGHEDLFLLQLPHQRWIRDHCPYRFRDDNCQYPDDEFGKNTEQNLLIGGDSNKGGGWNTLNIANAVLADINRTNAEKLTVQTDSGGPFKFYGTQLTAPQIYKVFKGNFQFHTRLSSSLTTESDAGFYVQSVDDLDDWMAWIAVEIDGVDYLAIRASVDTVTTQTSEVALLKNLRIDRIDDTIYMYAKADGDADWTLFREELRGDITHTVRVGFVFPSTTNNAAVQETFDYFRAISGGLTTCDYSFDGPNGCKAHMNEPNFGGAAGLPYGRINL